MHNKMKTILVCGLALSLLGSVGCKGLSKKLAKEVAREVSSGESGGDEAAAEGSGESRGGGAADPTREVSRKLSGYIKQCINNFSRRSSDSMRRYYSWCSKKKGPTGRERVIYGLYTLNDNPKQCADAVAKHNKMPPSDEVLEQAGTAYAAAITTLVPLLKEADSYYRSKGYKADKMAKGKTLHPRLVKAFDDFYKANKALYAAVESQQAKIDEVSLANIEKREGKKLLWHVKNTALQTKRLLKLNGYPKKLDVNKFKAALDASQAAYKALTDYAGTHKSDKNLTYSSSYISSTRSFLKACAALHDRAANKKAYSRGDKMFLGKSSEWMVKGSPAKVLREYNSMVNRYNSMMNMWK